MSIKLSGALQMGILQGGPSSINLADLHDVSIVSPQSGQYLRYNSGISEWQNTFLTYDIYNYLSTNLTSSTGIVLTKLSGPQTVDVSLATVNSTVGTFGSDSLIPVITADAQGRITNISVTPSASALGYTPVNIAGDTMTGLLILSGDPTVALGAVTKQYADNIASGVNVHASCDTSTTAVLPACTYDNGTSGLGATLTATVNGVLGTVGGYASLVVGSRILVKDQAATLQNGVYTVTDLGAVLAQWVLTRASDFDGSPTFEISAGDLTYIQKGTLAGTQWIETASGTGSPGDYIIVGTDSIVFSQFSGAGSVTAGTGISVTGNTVSNTGVISVSGTGTVSGLTLSGTVTSSGSLTLGGALTLTNGQITTGLGFTPYDATNPANYVTSAVTLTTTTQPNITSVGILTNLRTESLGVGTAASATAGEIRATNNITAYYSDDRLKTRTGKIKNALDKVATLDAFYYHANETAQALGYEPVAEVGISAQQVQAIMPEVVAPAPIDDKYLTVRYERLVPLLIAAIQELQAEIAVLKAR
jgi:hypothetical protein